jgi:uncharacterized protein with PIN domain
MTADDEIPAEHGTKDATHSRCPSCNALVEHPSASPDAAGRATHTSRDCPNCHAPLIFFSQGDFLQRWQVDDHERRSRERSDKYGD